MRHASEQLLALIKASEGFRSKPYRCPAGIPTIGFGSTRYENGRRVRMADKPISEERAKELLRHTLTEFERDVNSVVKVPLTQGQFDALVDFAYNVGTDIDADNITEGLGDSTLLKKLNAGDYDGAAKEFGKWVYSKGVRMAGLVKRRKAEVALFSQKEVL